MTEIAPGTTLLDPRVMTTAGRFRRIRGEIIKPAGSGGLRGKPRYSPAARSRLREAILSHPQQHPLMITLTYQDLDPPETKRDLHVFQKALMRECPENTGGLWKREYQERGTPHYHILLYGVDYLDPDWVGRTWTRIVQGSVQHREAGTRVEKVENPLYIAKYLSKTEEVNGKTLQPEGRHWGHINKPAFDKACDRRERLISPDEYVIIRRRLRRFISHKVKKEFRHRIRWTTKPIERMIYTNTLERTDPMERITPAEKDVSQIKIEALGLTITITRGDERD